MRIGYLVVTLTDDECGRDFVPASYELPSEETCVVENLTGFRYNVQNHANAGKALKLLHVSLAFFPGPERGLETFISVQNTPRLWLRQSLANDGE